jgi:peptidyl-prolyl cis-trans isomerase C
MSKDTGSAPKGGDLGWVSQSDGLVPEFVDAVTKLQKGTYTQAPVKTQYGFHVIRLDDVRDHKIETYDEVKDRLVAIVSQDRKWQEGRVAAMVSDLKTKAKIE